MPLTDTETLSLIRLAQAGDRRAADRLLRANEGLVYQQARYYAARARGMLDVEDLAQEGKLGLLHATLRFDPKRGCAFSTYAHHWIRQAIGRAIANQDFVRLPVHAQQAGRQAPQVFSLDYAGDEEDRLVEMLASECDVEAEAIGNAWVEQSLAQLHGRERLAVAWHICLGVPLHRVARVLGLSVEGTRQAALRGLARLREPGVAAPRRES